MDVYIRLTQVGANNGPTFSLFADLPAPAFTTAFATNVATSTLLAGYIFTNVPDGSTEILIRDTGGICDTEITIPIVLCTTTTSSTTSEPVATTTTTTEAPTTTTTSTEAPTTTTTTTVAESTTTTTTAEPTTTTTTLPPTTTTTTTPEPTTTTTSTTVESTLYWSFVRCSGYDPSTCWMTDDTKQTYEASLGTFQSGDRFYGAIEGDPTYLYTFNSTSEYKTVTPDCVVTGVTRTSDTCPA